MSPRIAILLAGLATGIAACSHPAAPAEAPVSPTGGVVEVVADDTGFHPSSVKVKKGEALTLRFKRTSDDTCARKVVFPELGVEKALPRDQPVDIQVPTDRTRTLTFQCGMGMYKSAVVVE